MKPIRHQWQFFFRWFPLAYLAYMTVETFVDHTMANGERWFIRSAPTLVLVLVVLLPAVVSRLRRA